MKGKGFSFIEVLLAMAIISFLIAGTAELLIRASTLKRHGDSNLYMTGMASSKLESLKSSAYESAELQADSSGEIIEDSRRETYRREWTVEDISPDMKRITVKVYSESHPERAVRIGLLISRALGF